MPNTNDVANPPAGGPQAFASTNDNNANRALHDAPWVVVLEANGQVGVADRFTNEAAAQSNAASRRAVLPKQTTVHVVRENDPDNGLPALLAKAEGGAEPVADEPAKAEQPRAAATAPKGR